MTTTSVHPPMPKMGLRKPSVVGRFPFGVLSEFQRDPLNLYLRAMHEHRDIARMRFGPRFSYALFHPDFIKRVLVDNNKNYIRNKVGNGLLKQVSGENLLTSDGDFWRRQRRLMQPAFHRQRILGFGQIMTNSATQMLERWEQTPDTHYIDMAHEMMQVTLHVVGHSLFSTDLLQDSTGLGRAIEVASAYFSYRLGRLLAPPLWAPTRRNREFKSSRAAVLHVVPEMIIARRNMIEMQGTADETGRQYDMLDLLLDTRYEDTGEGMDDEQLATEIRMFIAAGHETTSNSLTWTLYLLSQHPEVETQLHTEIDAVLAGRTPAVDDLPNLVYTKRVIEESMRLYPAAWAIARQSIAADQFGHYLMPANQGLVMPVFAVHRNPDFWIEPERFDPDRFQPDRVANQHKFAYFPFGGGPRQCIGNTFALTEAQLILAMIAQRYQPRLLSGYKVEPQPLITLKVKGGLPMMLQRR